ncbi:MAG: prepilin-type N-terminal cleavage/methylation domain-containing protein [Phycisphaeraceae bacterium]|nr:prepilin-type N-terminal cleavage/methylation domain-containing protein [Phycisphaeraceae bacterium]
MSPRTPARCAFTLIELLVVISIIALLLAILLPALTKAREEGRKASCLSTVRQIVTGAVAYSVDHEGSFPYMPGSPRSRPLWYDDTITPVNANNWLYRLQRYTNSGKTRAGFVCPTLQMNRQASTGDVSLINTYHANGVVTDLGGHQFTKPASIIFTGDENATSNTNVMGATMRPSLNISASSSFVDKTTLPVWAGFMRFGATANPPGALISDKPHNGGRNQGFMDGHGLYLPWQENTSLKHGLLINGQDALEADLPDYTAAGRVGVVKF